MTERNDWPDVELVTREDLPEAEGPPVLPWLLLALLGLGLLLGIVYYVTRERPPAPDERERAGAAAVAESASESRPPETAETETEDEEEAEVPLPPLSASDVVLRTLARELSSHPDLAAFLLTDELVRRIVVSVANVAEGQSPARQLLHLAPEAGFAAAREGGRAYLDHRAYRRYDRHAEVFASIDAEGAVKLYRRLAPLFEEAFAELGFPETRSFEETLRRAIEHLLDVPLVDDRLELVGVSVNYAYGEPRFERLSPAQKHLLRMGPQNTKRVQSKLAEIAAALGLELSDVASASRCS